MPSTPGVGIGSGRVVLAFLYVLLRRILASSCDRGRVANPGQQIKCKSKEVVSEAKRWRLYSPYCTPYSIVYLQSSSPSDPWQLQARCL